MSDKEALSAWFFDVYGVTVSVKSDIPSPASELAEDFAHFRVSSLRSEPKISLSLHASAPVYDNISARTATVYTPRNISFHEAGLTYIDYSGRALGIFDDTAGVFEAFSEDVHLLFEMGYLFLLSQLGERLDRLGIHRVHAVGISVEGRGALVMLPMGGGKSTLCASLLKHPEVKLLSDDSPLLNPIGELLAFPLRIGLLPGGESGYEPEQLRLVQRMEFGPKLLVRYEYFRERIVSRTSPAFLFVGRRSLSRDCRLERCSKLRALLALLPNCVIGLGLFQGMEFVFHRGEGEFFSKLRVAISRFRNCVALVHRSKTAILILGRDSEKNAAALLKYMESDSD